MKYVCELIIYLLRSVIKEQLADMPELIYLLRTRHISEPRKANHVIALTQTGRQACLGPVVLLCPKVIL